MTSRAMPPRADMYHLAALCCDLQGQRCELAVHLGEQAPIRTAWR